MRDAKSRRATVALLLALLASPAAAESFREEFDQAGGGVLAPTRFSHLVLGLNAGVSRGPTDPGQGAPSTGGVLPVDEGGDSEVRFYEVVPAAGSTYALTPEATFGDVEIDGYVGVGFTDVFGVRSATLVVRATPSPLNGYGVMLTHTLPGDTASLALVRFTDNVISNFATSDAFPVATASENYRLVLRATGENLTASVLRVEAIGGERVETPIDLDDAPGLQTELTATDGALTAGALGIRVFTRSTNSLFLDDVTVTDFVFLDGFETGDTSAWTTSTP